jgi:hypothetical protein
VSIDHASGGRDDLANAVGGALVLATALSGNVSDFRFNGQSTPKLQVAYAAAKTPLVSVPAVKFQ